MEQIIGMVLDFENMTKDKWILKLTEGTYKSAGVIRTVEPVIIKLNKDDYTNYQLEIFDLYYDPYKNKYNTIQRPETFDDSNYCPDFGYHLGGYMINGCVLRFLYPVSTTVEYVRPFSDEFSDGFVDDSIVVNSNVWRPAPFNSDFNLDFQTITVEEDPKPGNEFEITSFSSAFTII